MSTSDDGFNMAASRDADPGLAAVSPIGIPGELRLVSGRALELVRLLSDAELEDLRCEPERI